MSWSSEPRTRVRVMRAADVTRETVSKADLTTVRAPAARELVVDRQLVEDALADGFRAGYEAGFQSGLNDATEAAADRERARSTQVQQLVGHLAQYADELRRREGTAMDVVERSEERRGGKECRS